jgi:hypothetical protein
MILYHTYHLTNNAHFGLRTIVRHLASHNNLCMSHSILRCDYSNWISQMMLNQLATVYLQVRIEHKRWLQVASLLKKCQQQHSSWPITFLQPTCNVRPKQRTCSKQPDTSSVYQLVWLRGCTRLWSVNLINTVVRFRVWKKLTRTY